MFLSKNTIAHTDLEPGHLPRTRINRSIRASLMTLALLGGAGIFALQMSSPAFAAETNADAATKVQKHKRELANPNTYVLKRGQQKDNKAADAAIILEKEKQDYEKLAKTTKALMDALKRESEKVGVDNSDVFSKVESDLKDAGRQAKSGNYDEAHQTLEVGYHLLTTTVVKLENLKDQGVGDNTDKALAAKPDTSEATDPREYVEHELKTSKALLTALKHQNEDKVGGKEAEMEAITATATEARIALESGDIALAKDLIKDANSRTKKAIASLQTAPSKLPSGQEQYEAGHHPADLAHEENLRNDYAKRKASVQALLEAGRRLDSENHTSHAEFATAESMFNEAETLAAAGKMEEGKEQLDHAYMLIKNTMRSMLSLKEEPKPVRKKSTKTKPKQHVKTRADAQQ